MKTLKPSNIGKGSKLNNPNQKFMVIPGMHTTCVIGAKKAIKPNINPTAKFIAGPINDMYAIFLFVRYPLIITPPGAAKMKPKNENNNAIPSMKLFALNSAQQSYFCAIYLCPSSWNTNPTPTVKPAIPTTIRNLGSSENPVNAIANARDITNHALSKCIISVFEYFIIKIRKKLNKFIVQPYEYVSADECINKSPYSADYCSA